MDAVAPGSPQPTPNAAAAEDDRSVLAALRAGDETAFTRLVDMYNDALQRLALSYVKDAAAAQEVVQEAWIGLLESLDRFEGRSSLKTWLYRILINCARARARRESRSLPFSETFGEASGTERAVDGRRFYPRWLPGVGGHWRTPPARWQDEPEQRVLAGATREAIRRSIDALPAQQREVILLRDIAGCSAAEACNVLGLTDTNQRVLLHRARSGVRRALERLGEAPMRAAP
jgi:RNA polymerase sigma-70 factor (ECF subfamily)